MKTISKVFLLAMFVLIQYSLLAQNKKKIYTPVVHDINYNFWKKNGYYGIIEYGMGSSIGRKNGGDFILNINFINGYQFNPWFATGLGIGYRAYLGAGHMLPFFLDLRTNFLEKKTTPYFSLGTGYAVDVSNHYYGGLLLRPAFGVSFRFKNKTALNMAWTYELQSYTEPWSDNEKHTNYYHITGLQFGVLF
jgi:hypothetical protein